MAKDWFDVEQAESYLYIIRERFDVVDPRFYTKYTNMYLLVGDHSALLFDTGLGVADLNKLVHELIGNKDLMVINSHNHFDHVGSNYQFDETYVHRLDFKKLVDTMDLEFLKGCSESFRLHFENLNWKMSFADDMVPLIGNEIINLGGLEVELMYTPGHTPGSICLLTNKGDVLTGDTIHYGAIYLPSKDRMKYLLESIEELNERISTIEELSIYPGHEDYGVGKEIFSQFRRELGSLKSQKLVVDRFLQARIYTTENFTFVEPFGMNDPDMV